MFCHSVQNDSVDAKFSVQAIFQRFVLKQVRLTLSGRGFYVSLLMQLRQCCKRYGDCNVSRRFLSY